MQHWWYLLALVFSLGSLALFIDRRFRLLWWWDWRFTLRLLLLNLAFFLVWDVLNIWAGVIATNQAWVIGLHLFARNLPLEEFLFLTLLGYQTALLWRWLCSRTRS